MEQEKASNERKFIRLPPELAGQVEELAKQEARTNTNMAGILIKEALIARGIQC